MREEGGGRQKAEDGRRKAEGGTNPQGAVNRIGSPCAIEGFADEYPDTKPREVLA
jgi:hypothetical protein